MGMTSFSIYEITLKQDNFFIKLSKIKKIIKVGVGWGPGRWTFSYAFSGNINWYNPFGNIYPKSQCVPCPLTFQFNLFSLSEIMWFSCPLLYFTFTVSDTSK